MAEWKKKEQEREELENADDDPDGAILPDIKRRSNYNQDLDSVPRKAQNIAARIDDEGAFANTSRDAAPNDMLRLQKINDLYWSPESTLYEGRHNCVKGSSLTNPLYSKLDLRSTKNKSSIQDTGGIMDTSTRFHNSTSVAGQSNQFRSQFLHTKQDTVFHARSKSIMPIQGAPSP